MTTSVNPWNEAHKLAAEKINTRTQITALRKPDVSLTADKRNPTTHVGILHPDRQ
jgi:hypothetical protein